MSALSYDGTCQAQVRQTPKKRIGAHRLQTQDCLVMSYRHIADNGSKLAQEITLPRKRHFALWLLLGWTMFWLLSVLEPCYRNLTNDEAGQAAAVQVFGHATKLGNSYCSAPQGHDFCQSLLGAEICGSDAASAALYRVALSFDAAPVAFVPAPRHAGTVIAYTRSHTPQSGTPAYLRLQRLLI